MHWIMDCDLPLTEDGESLLLIHNDLELGDVWSWKSGSRFSKEEADFPTPILIHFDRRRGYSGLPMDLLDVGVPLISDRLRSALHKAGVDNIDYYDAVLIDSGAGVRHKFHAYNIIGRVSAVAVRNSRVTRYDQNPHSDASIEDLSLDESKMAGLLLFRLDENVNAIVVDDKIKVAIQNSRIDTLKFYAPGDWAQL